jgi:hypothetical protein
MDFFKLLVTLPDHSQMGMTGLLKSVPAWELEHGSGWATVDLLACATGLDARANANTGTDWGDIRARHQNFEAAYFLRRVAALRELGK